MLKNLNEGMHPYIMQMTVIDKFGIHPFQFDFNSNSL